MKFTLLDIEPSTLLIYLAAGTISIVIFYYIIKGAVKNGMIEANAEIKKTNNPVSKSAIPEAQWNPKQEDLKNKYDKGEITLEEYKKQWDELK